MFQAFSEIRVIAMIEDQDAIKKILKQGLWDVKRKPPEIKPKILWSVGFRCQIKYISHNVNTLGFVEYAVINWLRKA